MGEGVGGTVITYKKEFTAEYYETVQSTRRFQKMECTIT